MSIIEERKWLCEICNKPFKSETNLTGHKKRVHDNPTADYECSMCGRKMKTKATLNHHEKVVHSMGKRDWACNICDSTFKIEARLKLHVEQVHTRPKRFECNMCDYATPRACRLESRACQNRKTADLKAAPAINPIIRVHRTT